MYGLYTVIILSSIFIPVLSSIIIPVLRSIIIPVLSSIMSSMHTYRVLHEIIGKVHPKIIFLRGGQTFGLVPIDIRVFSIFSTCHQALTFMVIKESNLWQL